MYGGSGETMKDAVENYADFYTEISCDNNYVPSAIEHIESLDTIAIGLLSIGSILSIMTIYFAVDACHNILCQKDSKFYKTNTMMIMSVYPVASVCCLTAIAIPRGQLLSEAVTQIFLTISLYRLYLLLIDVGRRNITQTPPLILRVGPCCCWPCLPFPSLEMTEANLSWLGILVLQLPIVQGFLFFIYLFIEAEEPILATQYGVYLQPFMVISILLAIYGISISTKTLHAVAPDAKLHYKTLVLQLVLLFSKLQAGIIKELSKTGLFPCNPPLTPMVYANVTYNALMLIEMLLLCYAARRVYYVNLEKDQETDATDRSKDRAVSQTETVNMYSVNTISGNGKLSQAMTA